MADVPDDLEANMHTVTNEEWRAAHDALARTGALPEEELQFIWNPDLDPSTLIGPDEREVAPNG